MNYLELTENYLNARKKFENDPEKLKKLDGTFLKKLKQLDTTIPERDQVLLNKGWDYKRINNLRSIKIGDVPEQHKNKNKKQGRPSWALDSYDHIEDSFIERLEKERREEENERRK
jgi:hypothetical protein